VNAEENSNIKIKIDIKDNTLYLFVKNNKVNITQNNESRNGLVP
jgi:hypothetical protein